MRIAQVAPLYESVPPEGYGGTERVVAGLCNGLTAAGHDVTLFASATSKTGATLEPMTSSPLRMQMSRREMLEVAPHLHLRMLSEVARRAHEFDVIHSHVDVWTLPFAHYSSTPWVVTMHGRLDLPAARETLPLYPRVPLVSISDHQQASAADLELRWMGTVHNGLDLESYRTASTADRGYLAFVGRIHPDKGPALAVEIARRAGVPLRVAAKIDPLDVEYYRQEIRPLFAANDVCFEGELTEADKPAFFAGAVATVFPSDWPEPFGLVLIEAMAAGSPVVALRRGGVPEIIVDGVTGFVCDDLDDMVRAISRVATIDPEACRRRAAEFDVPTMCAGYERVYREILESWPHDQPGRADCDATAAFALQVGRERRGSKRALLSPGHPMPAA